jgi:hypothetical protein
VVELIARMLSGSSLAGARSSLTLLLLGIAGRMGWLAGLGDSWFASDFGLAVLLAMTVLEEFAEQDEDMQAVLTAINYGVRGTGGALTAWTLQQTGAQDLPTWLAPVLGAGLAIGTHHLRSKLHASLRGLGEGMLSPRTWLGWLEVGGVLGLCVAIVLAPLVALAFVVLAAIAGSVALVLRRVADRKLNYRPCPHCGRLARKEAWRCPHCRNTMQIERWLGQPSSSWG